VSILFSGDFISNYNNELRLITRNALIKKYGQEKYDAIKYHILLGDARFMLPDDQRRRGSDFKRPN